MIIFTKYYLNMNCTLKIYNFVFVATMKIKSKICSCHFLNHGFFEFFKKLIVPHFLNHSVLTQSENVCEKMCHLLPTSHPPNTTQFT